MIAPARIHVDGWALHGRTREYGPNMGEIDFDASLQERTATFTYAKHPSQSYKLTLRFEEGTLVATEEGRGPFGHGVYFGGRYERVG